MTSVSPSCVSLDVGAVPIVLCDVSAAGNRDVVDGQDIVLQAGGAVAFEASRAAQDLLRDLLGRSPTGMPFAALSEYLTILSLFFERHYAAAKTGERWEGPVIDVAALERLCVAEHLPCDGPGTSALFPLPMLLRLALMAQADLTVVAQRLAREPPSWRASLAQALLTTAQFRPRRTYQPDAEARRDEALIGAFLEFQNAAAGPIPFPTTLWVAEQTERVGGRPEDIAGAEAWRTFLAPMPALGEALPEQIAYVSAPNRLALVLRAFAGPRILQTHDPYRFYTERPSYAEVLGVWALPYGAVTLYAVDHVAPRPEVLDAVLYELALANEADGNPAAHIVFSGERHGRRMSIAAQGRYDIRDPLPALLGIDGDYLMIGLDAGRVPVCTVAHELGHQFYWQLVEDIHYRQGPGSIEAMRYAELHALYERAMATDGGELIDDGTYTGLIDSGHPYQFVEFFPAARHAFVHHGQAFRARLAALPPGHYGNDLWRFLHRIYGEVFTNGH
ncbi:MAG: hypothetical protein HY543_05730 [Deltaproteobacteria bacterium]|nr:hypothetical protein [Deltaproteobacteria bacterium]